MAQDCADGPERRVLAVVCDVGEAYGVGHLMRCVALAEEFAGRGFEVVFVADVASVPFALRQLAARGFGHRPAAGDLPGLLAALAELDPAVVVVDSYHLPHEAYVELQRRHHTLAMVDARPDVQVADVLLNQNIGAEDDLVDPADPAERGGPGQVLAGLRYALMREEVLARRPVEPEHAEADPLRVFAFFGGTDAARVAPLVTRALVSTAVPFALKVVSPHPWPADLAAGEGQSIEVIGPTDRLAEEVRAADLVLSAAGTSTWELLCLGAAVGLVCVADNQQIGYDRTVAAGLALGLGRAADLESSATPQLRRLLTDVRLRRELRSRGHAAVDGRGRCRVADAVLSGPPAKA